MPAATVKITLAANDWTQIGTGQGLIETSSSQLVAIHFGDVKPDLSTEAFHVMDHEKSFENSAAIGSWGRALDVTKVASVVFTDTGA